MQSLSNWNAITSLAYKELIEIKTAKFPLKPEFIKFPDIVVLSYQKYARLANIPVEDVSCDNELEDSYVTKELRPGLKLILYNEVKFDARRNHSVFHEVGHVRCGHIKHGEFEEIEAHFFAGQLNAPNILIKEIRRRGYRITVSLLKKCFRLSNEAAYKKLDYLMRYPETHPNEYDDAVLRKFSKFINTYYPSERLINMYEDKTSIALSKKIFKKIEDDWLYPEALGL